MMRMARVLTIVRNGVLAFGLSASVLVPRGPIAADDLERRRGERTDLAAPPVRSDADSPTPFLSRGAPERTGSVLGGQLPRHPVILWSRELGSSPGEPLLADGEIYVGDSGGSLYCVKLGDGSVRWRSGGRVQIFEAPAKRGDTIYFTSKNGLTALSENDGRVLWGSRVVANATESAPVVLNDRIIVADESGKVLAVDFEGKPLWQYDVVGDAPTPPPGFDAERARGTRTAARPRTAACDGTTLFQPIFDQSRIIAIDVKSGRRLWSFQAKGWIYGTPTVTGDKVFFGSQDSEFYCLDKRRKKLYWSFRAKSRIEAGAAFRDGSVYFGSCDGCFYRVNAETGKEVWSFRTPEIEGASRAIYSAPICAEDAVYFGSFDGHLYCLDLKDGAMNWRIQTSPGSEITGDVLTDGHRIVLATRRGRKGSGQNAIVAIGEDDARK
jgi:outer membrane protein assembly factor BamB